MKAAVYDRYGNPDVLQIRDVSPPRARRNQVLVRVHAAALNPKDVLIRRGKFRLIDGLTFPKLVGYDWAGEVCELGPGVSWPPVGARVFGMIEAWTAGACSEYVAANISELALAPANLSFEEAAALPLASLTSLQALRDVADMPVGAHVTIHGASGGVGVFAIQIAKQLGAHVTTTSSDGNLALCISLGADVALDYRQGRIVDPERRCDVFYDVFGNQSLQRVRPMLSADGAYVSTVPKGHVFLGWATTALSRQRCRLVMVHSRAKDLSLLARWAESGVVRPVIDSRFSLVDIRKAHARVETRRARGKVIVAIE